MIQVAPDWVKLVKSRWKFHELPEISKHGALIRRGIRLLEEARPQLAQSRLMLPEQPFDLHLLNLGPLYRRSRTLYLKSGGRFIPTLVSSLRTLSSPILLETQIEYSPIEREMVWAAGVSGKGEKTPGKIASIKLRESQLVSLRSYSSSLFHEQNHRILWKFLPPAPPLDSIGRGAESRPETLRRYLNFAESLVIVADMALGDQLGLGLASLFYLLGVTYDPGTSVLVELSEFENFRRLYRNYLQAALHSTYLVLEHYSPEDIDAIIGRLFYNAWSSLPWTFPKHSNKNSKKKSTQAINLSRRSQLFSYGERAVNRSIQLDQAFIQGTNQIWQQLHAKRIAERLCAPSGSLESGYLRLPGDPLDHRRQYLLAEKWFDLLGL